MTNPPPCVGEYTRDDTECDGNEADPHPCTWRDKCGAFRAHLRQSRGSRADFIDLGGDLVVEPYEFDRDCRAWAEKYSITDGLPPKELERVATMSTEDLFDVFLAYLVAEVDREFAQPGILALPGQMYLRDRRESHNYLTIYCRARTGFDKPLARMKIRRSSGALEIWLPVTARIATKLGLNARVLRSAGQFKSEVVLYEKSALALARKIGGLVDGGKIQLPERVAA